MFRDVDHVHANLWIGSAPDPVDSWSDICDCLVLCAENYQPDSSEFPDVSVIKCPFNDDLIPLTADEVSMITRTVNRCYSRSQSGQKVLFTCMAGLNRSSLVCSLVMLKMGMDPSRIVELVRNARGPAALSNSYFRSIIMGGGF